MSLEPVSKLEPFAPSIGALGAGCRVQGSGCRAQGSGFRVRGAGFGVWGLGSGVRRSGRVIRLSKVDRWRHVKMRLVRRWSEPPSTFSITSGGLRQSCVSSRARSRSVSRSRTGPLPLSHARACVTYPYLARWRYLSRTHTPTHALSLSFSRSDWLTGAYPAPPPANLSTATKVKGHT